MNRILIIIGVLLVLGIGFWVFTSLGNASNPLTTADSPASIVISDPSDPNPTRRC